MPNFFDRTIDKLRNSRIGPVVRLIEAHPRISAWLVLSIGMIVFLVIEAYDVGLRAGQWVALLIATILVAGTCILIITWDDGEDESGHTNDTV
nr:hypothetical protein [Anaerolineae bacterium]